MAANTNSLVTNFNVDPYYDDFSEDKNFHRVLFRPGFAVQARELTQMQTILQNQIDRLGEHFFKEGSTVTGAEINYDRNHTFIKIRDADSTGTTVVANNFIGTEIRGASSNILAVVVGSATGSEAETPNLKTLYVKYIDTGNATAAGNSYFTLGEIVNANTGGYSANVASSGDSVGAGSVISINQGIIFAKDHFIRVPAQSLVVGTYSSNVSFKVGLSLSETIVTSTDDTTLLDPAQGAYNYAAPGANRLKLTGELAKFSLTANTGQNFVEMFRIDNGIIQSKTDKPSYAVIGDYIARRTRDINGDFIVNGLDVRLREHLNQSNNYGVYTSGQGGDSTKLVVDVGPGKCYAGGYEIENLSTIHVPINKSTDFESVEALTVSANYGNYVEVKEVAGVWDVNDHDRVKLLNTRARAVSNSLYSTAPSAGACIGCARVRAIEYSSGTKGSSEAKYNMYLYDIQMSANTFSEVRSIFIDNTTSSQANGIADIAANTASLSEVTFNRSVFKLPADNIRRLRDTNGNIDTNFQFVKRFDVTIATDGTFTLATGAVDETFPFSAGALNTTQKQAGFYVSLNANTSSSTSVDTGSMSNLANTVTGLTAATGKFNVGDRIKFASYANTFTVTSVGATSLTTLQPALAAISTQSIVKKFEKGQVIDMSGVGGDNSSRSISIASSTSAAFDLQESLTNTVSATVITELTKVDGQEIAKTYRSNRYVKINANTALNTTGGPWDLGFSDVHKIINVRKHTANIVSSTDGTDVSTHFELDNGQTDNLYKHSRLKKKASSDLTIGVNDQLLVKLNYFNHDTSQGVGYFSVDSYPIDDTNAANTTAITTQEIPIYTSPTDGSALWLRDCIDIRPRIVDTSSDSTTIAGATVNPATSNTISSPASGLRYMAPNENMTADLDYYLPRNHVLSVSPTGNFKVTSGRSDAAPLYPEEPSGHLPLAKIAVPPYPSLSPDVGRIYSRPDLTSSITPVRTEGYTMKEIGQMKARLDEIEYRTALTYLETQAKSLYIANPDTGVDRFKNGIIVDSFTGHNIGNVYNPDYKAAIDPKENELRPSFRVNNVGLTYSSANSTNIIIRPRDAVITVGGSQNFNIGETITAGAASGKLVYQVGRKLYLEDVTGTFAVSSTASGGASGSSGVISVSSTPNNGKYATPIYSHDKVIEQPFATTSRNAAGMFWNFTGDIELTPDTDYWVDTTTAPDVQINFDSNFDNWGAIDSSWQTSWNAWQTTWVGSTTTNRNLTIQQEIDRAARTITRTLQQQTITADIVNQSRTGVRTRTIPETVTQSIGPRIIDTNLIPFMRSRLVNISGTGFKPNTRLYSFFDDVDVSAYITPADSNFANTALEGSAVSTDSSGNVFCNFRLPNDSALRFRVGDRLFRFTDNSTNSKALGTFTTSAESLYSARGLTQTVADTIISTRVPRTETQVLSTNRTLQTNVRVVNTGPAVTTTNRWDPIAQTFKISDYTDLTSSSGAFLTKIDLYFATKDENRPVYVEIREVDPTSLAITSKIVPFSNVTLQAADINTSSNGGAPTPVTFSTPIFLTKEREYAIVIRPAASNPNVSLFVARLGEEDLINNQRVSKQPNVGVLFASSNDRVWTPIQEEDLKFNVYIASFDTALTGTAIFKNDDIDFLKISGSNTFNVVGEAIHGPTTIVTTTTGLSVNANFVLVGNTSGANASVVSQSSNTIIVNDVSLNDKFQAGERVNVVINGSKQEPFATVHSVATPTGRVLYYDSVNDASNTFLHIDSVSGVFSANTQIKGQTDGYTAVIDSLDKLEVDLLHLNTSYLSFEDNNLAVTGRLNTSTTQRDVTFVTVEDNENTSFSTPRYILSKSLEATNISGDKSAEFKYTITTSNNRVAPVIDLERANAIVVDNIINNDSTNETDAAGGNANARYITRTLALADGQDAEDIRVRLSGYRPTGTDIEIYYKILNGADGDSFDDKPWVQMSQATLSDVYSDSENQNDFVTYEYAIAAANKTGSLGEVQYTASNGVTYTGYKYFAIKVVLKSSSDSIVPRVKNLIAIALQI